PVTSTPPAPADGGVPTTAPAPTGAGGKPAAADWAAPLPSPAGRGDGDDGGSARACTTPCTVAVPVSARIVIFPPDSPLAVITPPFSSTTSFFARSTISPVLVRSTVFAWIVPPFLIAVA